MFLLSVMFFLIIVGLIYIYLIWNFGYWLKRGVTEAKARPLVGSYASAFHQKRHVVFDLDDIYRKYKKDENFVGIFNCRTPQLLIINPELAHKVLVNDFKHFHDNEISQMISPTSDKILARNPFTLAGNVWKETRAQITPGLTSNKIKAVYPITRKVCGKLSAFIRQEIRVPPKGGLDAKELFSRYTSEIVSDCVLGMEAKSFSNEPSLIMETIQKIFNKSFLLILHAIAVGLVPWIRSIYKMRFIPKPIEKFFIDLAQNAIDTRRGGGEQLQDRNDFLNYVIKLQEKKPLTAEDVAAHAVTFLLDGYETTASVLTHCLLLLARNPETFRALHEEICANLDSEGQINFEKLHDLPYLDACIHESLRIFPACLFTNKLCTETIELTNKNGKTLVLDKGKTVVLPFMSIMNDEDYYSEPQKFRPERFLEDAETLRIYRDKGLYYGFSDGPRICLGMRFALTQAKAAIVEIVKNFKVSVNPRTRKDYKIDATYLLARLDGGVWLDFEERH